DALPVEGVEHTRRATVDLERIGARRPEDGAAAMDEAACAGDGELDRLAVEHAAPTVAEADELIAVHALTLSHDGAYHPVESRTAASAGEHPDAHDHQCVASELASGHADERRVVHERRARCVALVPWPSLPSGCDHRRSRARHHPTTRRDGARR